MKKWHAQVKVHLKLSNNQNKKNLTEEFKGWLNVRERKVNQNHQGETPTKPQTSSQMRMVPIFEKRWHIRIRMVGVGASSILEKQPILDKY